MFDVYSNVLVSQGLQHFASKNCQSIKENHSQGVHSQIEHGMHPPWYQPLLSLNHLMDVSECSKQTSQSFQVIQSNSLERKLVPRMMPNACYDQTLVILHLAS